MSERPVIVTETPTYDQVVEELAEAWSNGCALSSDEAAILLHDRPELEGQVLIREADHAA